MAQGPCLNPNCSSNGRPHPNCRCYVGMADGGEAHTLCLNNGKHKSHCVYFMAEGGAPQELPPDPEISLTQAVAHHGLSGVLQNTGQAKLANIKLEHATPLLEAKDNFIPVQVESGHPLVGQMPKHEREHVLKHLSHRVMTNEVHPEAFRSAADHLKASYRGNQLLNEAIGGVFNKGIIKLENKDTSQLQEQLEDLSVNPSKALDIGGSVGHYLPEQAASLGALTGAAISYFQSIKPMKTTTGMFSEPAPINKSA